MNLTVATIWENLKITANLKPVSVELHMTCSTKYAKGIQAVTCGTQQSSTNSSYVNIQKK